MNIHKETTHKHINTTYTHTTQINIHSSKIPHTMPTETTYKYRHKHTTDVQTHTYRWTHSDHKHTVSKFSTGFCFSLSSYAPTSVQFLAYSSSHSHLTFCCWYPLEYTPSIPGLFLQFPATTTTKQL